MAAALDDVNSVHASPLMNSRARPVVLVDEDSVADAANTVAEGDPFRLSNVPAFVAYSPAQDGGGLGAAAAPLVSAHPAEHYRSRASSAGPPWQAMTSTAFLVKRRA